MAATLPRPAFCRVATAPSRWNSAATSTMPPTGGCWRSIATLAQRPIAGRDRDRADLSIAAGALRSRADRLRRAGRKAAGARRNCRFRRPQERGAGAFPWSMAASTASISRMSPRRSNTTPDDIVARHVAGDYRVAMIGFTPGWSYLSGLDEFAAHAAAAGSAAADAGRHDLDRRRADRRAMPGRPERLASAWDGPRSEPTSCTAIPIFLLEPGDAVTFSAVDAKTFAEQDRAAEAGEIVAELIAVMSKLVISSIGPASSVQDGGRHGAAALRPDAERRDGSARAGGGEYAWSETTLFAAAIEIGPFGAAFTARGGAVRVALAGASRNADIAGTRRGDRHVA